ncbi:MAG: TIGR04283 family arsenosugar biosynthesis glycosyltransferase [Pseudomonadota bacterium]
MISIVIPTLNAEARLGLCLEALIAPTISGLVKEVIVVDGGSEDRSREIADGYGASILSSPPGRGRQLAAGARAARAQWLLCLHADTVLGSQWERAARDHMNARPDAAGVFCLRFDAGGFAPRLVAMGAMLRTRVFKLPYGDQGLFISRALYDEIGGYGEEPLFEDVAIIRRLTERRGRSALRLLPASATTSAARYQREGYLRRVLRNQRLLARYLAGETPEALVKDYR